MTAAASGAAEVWLRGNPRPAIAGAVAFGLAAAAAIAIARAVGAAPGLVWTLAAVGVAGGGLAAALVAVASLPRLVRQGAVLRVRLAPLQAHDVPLEIVECVFPGSSPLPDAAGERRVGTVVVRLAERASDWKTRPTFASWGGWEDGHVVIDGRWCEPLSLEVTKQLGQRILEAKREVAAAGAVSPEGCR